MSTTNRTDLAKATDLATRITNTSAIHGLSATACHYKGGALVKIVSAEPDSAGYHTFHGGVFYGAELPQGLPPISQQIADVLELV